MPPALTSPKVSAPALDRITPMPDTSMTDPASKRTPAVGSNAFCVVAALDTETAPALAIKVPATVVFPEELSVIDPPTGTAMLAPG